MIEILNEYDLKFISYINKLKLTDKKVKLSILHNYQSVGSGDDNVGFAVYLPELNTIMLPTEKPEELEDDEDFVIHNLAHEYKHFLQDCNGEEFNEDEADKFADDTVGEEVAETSAAAFKKTDDNKKFIEKCKNLVVGYFNEKVEKTDNKKITVDDVYLVWVCKTLQNNKALLSTNVSDGMYYEITFNGDKNEFYFDAYKKWENICIKNEEE